MDKIIEIKNLTDADYGPLMETMNKSYPNWEGGGWREGTYKRLLQKFPQGQFVIFADGVIVGSAFSIIVKYDEFDDDHTYNEIIGDFTFSTHNPKGDVLYGVEVFVHPEYRGLRLGRRLYDARKELCEKMNLKAIVFGGRIPHYHKFSDTLSPKEYIQKVKMKEIYDPVLTFQFSNDFHVKKVLKNYMPEDLQSEEFATLLQWDNVYYTGKSKINERVRKNVRIGLIQWKMRLFADIDELFQQAEHFVDAISNYKADFAVFPEYFNAPLMHEFNEMNEADAMRAMAQFTESIKNKFSEMAMSYNVNIIAGSMPLYEDNRLRNVGYLCHRDGKIDIYEKMHITPDEAKYWGLEGGNILQTYLTDVGRIGILICYDVEFPELPRLLAEEGMQILFVPYLTDTQNAYMRVRSCAAARAIENECFVAITGSVGNLPQVENFDLHYSQATVFTPCDFAFPYNGIKSEATANTEMILIADVDLKLLDELHSYGSVRNLKDRRKDFYSLKKLK